MWTAEQAKAMSRIGAEKSRAIRLARKSQPPILTQALADDPIGSTLLRACRETLALVRSSKESRDRANHARALRELRETYHMVTGLPKPGNAKPTLARKPVTVLEPVVPTVPAQPTPAEPSPPSPACPSSSPLPPTDAASEGASPVP